MIRYLEYPHLWVLILGWFLVYLLMPGIIWSSHRIGAVDRPGGHKGHRGAVSFLGGLGIFIAFSVAVVSTIRDLSPGATILDFAQHEGGQTLCGIVLGALIVVILGIIDDFRPIHAILKLGVLVGVTILIYFCGVRMTMVYTHSEVLNALFNVPLTVLWIAGVTSAMNSLDNTDGAAAGSAAVASAVIFFVAWGTSAEDAQPWLSYLAVALIGACLGFLRYNYHPAKVFLGDGGSLLLGFLLASMLVLGRWSPNPFKSAVIPCVILTVPLFDITLSTILRIRHGIVRSIPQAITYSGRDHIAHRLVAMGLSTTQAVLSLYLFGVISGFIAILIFRSESAAIYIPLIGFYFLMLIGLGVLLDRAGVYGEREAPSAAGEAGQVAVGKSSAPP